MVDAGIFEARATPGRGRRKVEAAGLDEGLSPVKKRRGRPRKSETAAEEGANGGVTPGTQTKKRKKVDPLSPPEVDDSLVGQPVHGVLDGSFDAGYILTVRVGGTDTILRGVVFGPGLSVPITKANDIAPNVKFAEPHQVSPLSSPAPTSTTPVAVSQELVVPSSASTFTGGATPTVPPQDSKDHTVVQAYTPVSQDYTPIFGVQTLATGVTEQPTMETVHSVQRPVAERPQPGAAQGYALGVAQHLANGSQAHVVKAESTVESTGDVVQQQQQQLVRVTIGPEPVKEQHSQAGPAEHQHMDE